MRYMCCARMEVLLVVLVVCLSIGSERARGDFVFGEPTKVPEINSSGADHYPQISRDGLELYFTSNRPYGADRCYEDTWVATRSSTRETWGTPVQLSAPINSDRPECCPCVSADGLELYFTDGVTALFGECGENPNGYGGSDLWVATRASKADPWGEPLTAADEHQQRCLFERGYIGVNDPLAVFHARHARDL